MTKITKYYRIVHESHQRPTEQRELQFLVGTNFPLHVKMLTLPNKLRGLARNFSMRYRRVH